MAVTVREPGEGEGMANVLQDNLPIYLNDEAHEWCETLPEEVKTSYPLLKTALITEYTPKAASKFERETVLRSHKQDYSMSVKDFVSMVRREARAIALPEDKGVEIVLNNMLPTARATIAARPATYDAILATPVAQGEIPLPKPTTDSGELVKQLLQALTKKDTQIAALLAERDVHPSHTSTAAQPPAMPCPDQRGNDSWQRLPARPSPSHQANYRQQRAQPPAQRPRGQHYDNRRQCRGCGGRCLSQSACPANGCLCHYCGLPNHLDKCCARNPRATIKFH